MTRHSNFPLNILQRNWSFVAKPPDDEEEAEAKIEWCPVTACNDMDLLPAKKAKVALHFHFISRPHECDFLMFACTCPWMALDWRSFDRQFEPYPARLRWRPRGVAWDAVPESMVKWLNAPGPAAAKPAIHHTEAASDESDDEDESVESADGADPGKVMFTHITPPFSLPSSLSVGHCCARTQTHYCPVACCGMRMQAPSFTVTSTIYVHAFLTLVCLSRALRLTRPSHRLPRPSRSLTRLTRLFSYLTSPGRTLPRHQGREGLCHNQLSVGLSSHWTLYPLLLRNLRYSNTWLVCPSVPYLTRYSGDCHSHVNGAPQQPSEYPRKNEVCYPSIAIFDFF
jgi:hypothetical protein